MNIQEHFSLKSLNSFGFDVRANSLVKVTSVEDARQAIHYAHHAHLPIHILGGGSNVVLLDQLPGLTMHMAIMGKEIIEDTPDAFFVRVGAGEDWHAFVAWTLHHGMPGLENLALIPGTCGAAPIQNIGAYGVEIGDWIDSVEAIDTSSADLTPELMSHAQCQFTYRHSIFKSDQGRYIVTHVVFRIPKQWQANLHYADLKTYFQQHSNPSAHEVFEAVCEIRSKKLPDPKHLGNAGSFFHNPIVHEDQLQALLSRFPNLVFYPNPNSNPPSFKLAAGWLIDQCGFKGLRAGNVGVYEKQALVLVHYGHGSGQELQDLARIIQEKIHTVYGVDLIQEPVQLP